MKVLFSTVLILLCSSILFFQSACSDKLPEVITPFCDTTATSYNLNIQPIIEKNCAYSGCHSTGFAAGDYSSYAGLLGGLNDGSFETHVVGLKDDPLLGMPPSYAPNGKPQDLEDEELELIKCWLAAGHPEDL